MDNINNPHDKIVRKSLRNIEVVKDFLITHLPKDILVKFDLNDIQLCDNNYIDPKLTEQSSDIVYRSKMLDGISIPNINQPHHN